MAAPDSRGAAAPDGAAKQERLVVAAEARIRTAQTAGSIHGTLANARDAQAHGTITPEQFARLQKAGWRRLAELAGQASEDALTRRWHEGIAAFEALTEKRAGRTRPMLARHGARGAFARLVDRKDESSGFGVMIEAGLHDMTAEWIVLEFGDLFEQHVRAIAEARLAAAGVSQRP